MKLYLTTCKIFIKHKRLWMILLLFNVLAMVQLAVQMVPDIGQEFTLLECTKGILLLSPQFLVLYMIIGYEFFSEQYRSNLNECLMTMPKGYNHKTTVANFAMMTSLLFLNFVVLTGFDLSFTYMSFTTRGITDVNYQATWYIIQCLFVNIFMIGMIGILCGLLISKISKRILGYSLIMAILFTVTYLIKDVATLVMVLTDYTVNLYSILDILNIMTPGLNFLTNGAIGFPMMTYRISLIAFWISLLLLLSVIVFGRKKKSVKTAICLCLCVITFVGYALPSSRVDMGLSVTGSAMADQHYYDLGKYRIEKSSHNFTIDKYEMKLDVRRLLKAEVTVTVSKALPQYELTLSHSYDVKRVYDQKGKNMKFKHHGDALLVHNQSRTEKQFTIEYSGANEAYYANSQGINLRGSFPYYPIAGYRQITEDGLFMDPLFVEPKATFDLSIKSGKQIYSNLKEIEKNHFVGKSNGPTLLSGLYTAMEVDGIRIVYPFLNGWNKENLLTIAKAVKDEGYEGCQVFITPNMNRQDDAVSREQIITRNFFGSVTEDLGDFKGK